MFFIKIICGLIVSFEGCREYCLPKDPSLSCRFVDTEYEYEMEHELMSNYKDYFVSYSSITISYKLDDSEKTMELKNATFFRHYKVGDSILLVYNRLNQTVKVKG